MSKGVQENDHLLDAVALLVLDVQERLLPAMAEPEIFTDRVAFAIEAARHFNLKVIFTEQVPEKLGPTLPRLRKLAPNARVFQKSSFSALQAKGLEDYLREQNIYHLLVCGLETPVCVYQTALQAADLDHDTTLLSDCLTSRRPEDDAFVLPALTHNGCHLLPSETVFYSMVADAKSAAFRGYSQLVKHYDALRRGEQPPEPTEPESRQPAKPNPKTERKKSTRARKVTETKNVVEAPPEEPVAEKEPKAAPKRSRGRRRKTPVESATEAAVVEKRSESSSKTDAGEPTSSPKEARKPRRRKRGPRKTKSDSAPDAEKSSKPAN